MGIKKTTILFILVIFVSVLPAIADRTIVRAGRNLFTVQQDIEMGRALTEDAERVLQLSNDSYAHGYINALGDQLAMYAPGSRYPYEFRIVDDDQINSFALPGGFVYVTRGLVETAETEPELAGLLAHQIAHVALRHGTQQVSREWSTRSPNSSRVSVPNALDQLNIGFDSRAIPLRFSAEEERQADLIGAQILYDARFDPGQMALFIQRLGSEEPNRTADFFDNHPGIRNRVALVRREIQNMGGLRTNLRGDSPDLHKTQANLRAEGSVDRNPDFGDVDELPSTRTVLHRGHDFDFRYPENWEVTENGDVLTVAPYGGVVSSGLEYGMNMGTFEPADGSFFGQTSLTVPGTSSNRTSLTRATDELIAELRRSNPDMQVVRNNERGNVDGSTSMITRLTNDSPAGGRETDWLVTVLRPDGILYYFVGVAPEREFNRYVPAFQRIVESVRFYD